MLSADGQVSFIRTSLLFRGHGPRPLLAPSPCPLPGGTLKVLDRHASLESVAPSPPTAPLDSPAPRGEGCEEGRPGRVGSERSMRRR